MNWDLTKLYQGFDDPAFLADMDKLQSLLEENLSFICMIPEKSDAIDALTEAIERAIAAETLATKLSSMIFLTLSVDAQNEVAQRFYDKLMKCDLLGRQFRSLLCEFIGKQDDIDALANSNDVLKKHAFLLHELKLISLHLIPKELEPSVLSMQLTGSHAWESLRDKLDATLLIDFEQGGEVSHLPLSAVRNLAYSADPDVRKRGYTAEINAYPRIEIPMAACLNGIKGEALTILSMKHYEDALDHSLDISRMDHETLDAMITAMQESLPEFRRYFKLKAKALGHQGGLPFYDMFAPMGTSDRKFTLSEARNYLENSLGKFSARMATLVARAFDERWIDAFPRAGKQGGAFCSGVHPLGISYVMTNFDGTLSAVSTLAHELGHAYHNYCVKDQPILLADYPMPLAETASIFNETLLAQTALQTATPEEALMLLDMSLSDAAQVIVDILSRFLFEREVFARRVDHALSPDELKSIMLDAQKQTYGDGLDENMLHPYMWACKGHYYSVDRHYYNFPYAFGLLFGKGVYANYLAKGAEFPTEYDALLAATSSDNVVGVAKRMGIDVHSVDFWRTSLGQVKDEIDRFEELLGK